MLITQISPYYYKTFEIIVNSVYNRKVPCEYFIIALYQDYEKQLGTALSKLMLERVQIISSITISTLNEYYLQMKE
ncbi:hypothetical protein bsdtb5_35700 [Anaeromicropila herbilytica]|uniref:Uncharacterized protein n=1 Tax=Anaeromicropila herbilytica TaxID=2785025 RepID=A0A7R7ENM5_9FIRM|nr:hypothetical protein bsdtb5_35700 [Anaeromicropila herbilytica]